MEDMFWIVLSGAQLIVFVCTLFCIPSLYRKEANRK